MTAPEAECNMLVRSHHTTGRDLTVECAARRLLEQHWHFNIRSAHFQFILRGDVLTIRGRVPTFYLKQVLQTVLKKLDGVRQVDNQVDVVRSEEDSAGQGIR